MLWNYLLLPRLCTESPEQWPEKFRKMPLCSDSESRDSWTWSMVFSRLDGGLVPELSPLVSPLDTSEPVQCMSSPGEGSGRIQGDGCWDWTGWGHFSLGCGAWLEVTVSEQTQSKHVQFTLFLLIYKGFNHVIRYVDPQKSLFCPPVCPPEAVEPENCWTRQDVLPVSLPDSTAAPLSSRQDVISETEWRLTQLTPPPAPASASYSTTGVSMGTL